MDAKGTTVTKKCVGWVRGATFADLPDDLVPKSLVRIKLLWNAQGAKAENKVCNELSRYVKASFVPINVRHLSEISPLPTDIDAFIDAKRVCVEYFC
jgi:hypothetical protein